MERYQESSHLVRVNYRELMKMVFEQDVVEQMQDNVVNAPYSGQALIHSA